MLDTPPPIEEVERDGGAYLFQDENILGTRLRILLTARNHGDALAAAQAARAEIDRLNAILNERDPTSELAHLNRSTSHHASEELFTVVGEAERWRSETGGAFSGRLGAIIAASDVESNGSDSSRVAELAALSDSAEIVLNPSDRSIAKPATVALALEAFAKGWIVDRAFEVARSASGIAGALVDIGGDIRCGGWGPNDGAWEVGVVDPLCSADNAPIVATTRLSGAIATSGRGPRDPIVDGIRRSVTLDPDSGQSVSHHISATVVAERAADADALATALLVLPTERGLQLAARLGVTARITDANGKAHVTPTTVRTSVPQITPLEAKEPSAHEAVWHRDWQALATFTAPRRQLIRDPDFRSPYMTMWITDLQNRPIRTLLMVGKRAEWQKDNFIWWSMHRERVDKLISTRSMSTSKAGVYNAFWDGVDDAGNQVSPGTYVLHVETSRERGKHTYRSLVLDFRSARRFTEELSPTEEGGGLRVSFDHY